MPIITNFEDQIIRLMRGHKYGWFTTGVNLGGVTGASGGTGGPIGGFTGQLRQSKVTFDTSENEIWAIPVSGESLVTNLDRIRFRLASVEASGGGGAGGDTLVVQWDDAEVASGVIYLNFEGDVSVLDNGSSKVTITMIGGEGGGGGGTTVVFEDLTAQVPDASDDFTLTQTPASGSLRVYLNGLLQRPTNITNIIGGFHTEFSPITNDELLAVYDVGGGGATELTILDDGVWVASGIDTMNFVGAYSVTASGTTTTVVFSGGGAGGGATELDDLTDVTITGPTTDEVLGYSGGWLNRTLSEAGISPSGHIHNDLYYTEAEVDTLLHDSVTVQDTSSLDLELTGQALSGYVIPGGVDHDQLLNFSSDEHFTEASIDHTAIQNIGTSSHSVIDAHLASGVIHFLETDISHTSIQDIGTSTHSQIDAHLASGYIHTPSGHIHDDRYYTETEIDVHTSNTAIHFDELDELSDVTVAGASQGHALTYDGADWVPSGLAGGHDPITVTDTASLDLELSNQAVSGYVLPGGVDHDQLLNFTSTEHFIEGAIDHVNIQSIGTNSHAVIDTHLASGSIHFAEESISHLNIQDIGTNAHTVIDSHISDTAIHFDELGETSDVSVGGVAQGQVLTYDGADWVPSGVSAGTLDHGALQGLEDDDHPQYAASGHLHDSRYYTETEIDVWKHDAITVTDTASLNLELTGQAISGYVLEGGLDHGSIAGLGDDDHTQYLLLAGETTSAKMYSGADITLYSDAGSTAEVSLVGSTGDGIFSNSISAPSVYAAGAALALSTTGGYNIALTPSSSIVAVTGSITVTGTVDGVDVAGHAADSSIHFVESGIQHGSIAGLGDDDHPQYAASGHLHDSRYSLITHEHAFLDLSDITPTTYSGYAGYSAVVNPTETGLEFVNVSGGAGGDSLVFDDLTGQIPDVSDNFDLSQTMASGTLQVYYNGLYQKPTNYAAIDNSSFHTYFSPESGEELIAQYLVAAVTGGGGGSSHAEVTVVDTTSLNLELTAQALSGYVLSAGVDHDLLINTHNLTTNVDHASITNTHNLTSNIDHDSITNTHNLTTNIDHDTITNTHDLTNDIDHNTITNNHNLTTDINHNTILNNHNLSTDIDHGGLGGVGDDDHSLYPLVTNFEASRATIATNWTDLTDGGETTLHSHAGGAGGADILEVQVFS